MKTKIKVIYLSIITILVIIIIFQGIKNKNKNILPTDLLQWMVNDRKEMLVNRKFDMNSLTAQYISELTDYCINNNVKDSINKFVDIAVASLDYNDKNLMRNLKSKDAQSRLCAFKMLEYLLLDKMTTTLYAAALKFDGITLAIFSNTRFNNKELKLGEDYKAYIAVIAGVEDPFRVFIEGEKDTLCDAFSRYEYVRTSIQRGKQIVKGKATFIINGKPQTFPFEDEYVVE